MLDGALLGKAVAEHPGETEQALTLTRRALPAQRHRHKNPSTGIEVCFGKNAVDRLIEMFSATPPDNTDCRWAGSISMAGKEQRDEHRHRLRAAARVLGMTGAGGI